MCVCVCGVILYALIVGCLPFDDDNLRVLLEKVSVIFVYSSFCDEISNVALQSDTGFDGARMINFSWLYGPESHPMLTGFRQGFKVPPLKLGPPKH